MLKYLRDKLFFDLGPTATTDLSRPLRHDYVAAIFTRHMSRVGHHYLYIGYKVASQLFIVVTFV